MPTYLVAPQEPRPTAVNIFDASPFGVGHVSYVPVL